MNTNWRKYTILFAILALLTGAVATSFAQDGGDMGELENPTHITIVHNIEGAPPVDVYVGDVGGAYVVEDLAFGDESAPVDLEAGTYTVSVVPAGALSPVVYTTDVELVVDTVYQLSVNGSLDALDAVASELTTVEDMDETTDAGDEATDDGETDEATDAGDETTDAGDETTDAGDEAADDAEMDETTDTGDEATDGAEMDAAETVADVIAGQEQLSNIGFALDAVRLAETLGGEGPYTVFAPSNDVLNNIELLKLLRNRGTASSVLLNHVVEGNYTAEDLAGMDGGSLTTMAGYELAVVLDGETVTIGGVAVVEADLTGSNGVVHVIEGVLAPPADGDMEATDDAAMDEATDEGDESGDEAATDETAEMGTVVDVIAGAENLTTLAAAMTRDDLGLPVVEVLSGEGPYTIFAPNDEAFAAVDEIVSQLGGPSLAGVLSSHVVTGDLTLEDLEALAASDNPQLATVLGIMLTVSLDEDGNVVLTPGDGAFSVGVLTGEMLEASNGRIYILSSMIIPPPPPGTPGTGGEGSDGGDAGAGDSTSE